MKLTTVPPKRGPGYAIMVRALPDPTDPEGVRRLRSAVKMLLRRFKLRVTAIAPVEEDGLEREEKKAKGRPPLPWANN